MSNWITIVVVAAAFFVIDHSFDTMADEILMAHLLLDSAIIEMITCNHV